MFLIRNCLTSFCAVFRCNVVCVKRVLEPDFVSENHFARAREGCRANSPPLLKRNRQLDYLQLTPDLFLHRFQITQEFESPCAGSVKIDIVFERHNRAASSPRSTCTCTSHEKVILRSDDLLFTTNCGERDGTAYGRPLSQHNPGVSAHS